MRYAFTAVPETRVPRATAAVFQHALDTYASETNKVISVWRVFQDDDLEFRPHPRSSSVLEVMKHQLLSERRFFGEFLGAPEPDASAVLPKSQTVESYIQRMTELALPRLDFLAGCQEAWWRAEVDFFEVKRERAWVFWRRVLHTAHHRTQLSVYLRLRDKTVPPTYGPTADATWEGADPTQTVEAAQRK